MPIVFLRQINAVLRVAASLLKRRFLFTHWLRNETSRNYTTSHHFMRKLFAFIMWIL